MRGEREGRRGKESGLDVEGEREENKRGKRDRAREMEKRENNIYIRVEDVYKAQGIVSGGG